MVFCLMESNARLPSVSNPFKIIYVFPSMPDSGVRQKQGERTRADMTLPFDSLTPISFEFADIFVQLLFQVIDSAVKLALGENANVMRFRNPKCDLTKQDFQKDAFGLRDALFDVMIVEIGLTVRTGRHAEKQTREKKNLKVTLIHSLSGLLLVDYYQFWLGGFLADIIKYVKFDVVGFHGTGFRI